MAGKTRSRRARSVRRSTRARKYISARKAIRRAKNTNFNRKVKMVLSSLAENKQAYHTTGNSLVKFNSGIDAVGDLVQILPSISQGVAENQRIGNQIRTKNLNVRGYIKLDINDVDDSTKLPHVLVRMMVVSMKVSPSYQDAQTLASKIGTLLKKGGTTTGYTGLLQDQYAPLNTDVFTIHKDMKFALKQDYINVVGASPPSTRLAQDVSKTIKFFNFNVRCKNRLLRYDEDVGSDIYPSNFGPFLVLGYTYADGSSADVLDTKVGLCFDSILTYEDA